MLENIMDLVKEHAGDLINSNSEIPADQKGSVIDTITGVFGDQLKDQLTPSNLMNLTGMLSGGGSGSASSLLSGLQSGISNALVQKAGLNQVLATTISSSIVPMVMNAFSSKVNDSSGDSGFNLGSLVKSFLGNNDDGHDEGGLLGKITNLFK